MQDLTLVGLTQDKRFLVLVSDSGEEFAVPADARLHAALRGDHARLGQLEIQMDSALRPRDIQARIRAGESPESVAQAAQTTVDRIMGYATPVLAERAHIAERAQRSSVRRKAGDGPARILGDAVAERLSERGVDPSAVEWDAWRRQDGRWKLVVDYRSGETTRHAEFMYDAPGRYVVAEDDEARWLIGEQSSRKGPQPRAGGTRRLTAVNLEEELPLGADAIDLVADAPSAAPATEAPADEPTEDLTETAATVRDGRGAGRPTDPADDRAHDEADDRAQERPDDAAVNADDEAGAETAPETEPPPEPEPDPAPAKKPAKKSRRPSVPSWDDIMFGGGKKE